MASCELRSKRQKDEIYFLFPCQEFDNYAEWDLKDIDFVDDDSDILRGETLFIVFLLANRQK